VKWPKLMPHMGSGFIGLILLLVTSVAIANQTSRSVWIIDVNGAISPSTSDFIVSNLQASEEQKAALFILRLDTPGGLSASMRVIIKHILASPIPVVTFVSPKGARAASAGTYILYASHVAAMAPATNLGAATPIQIGAPSLPAQSNEKKDSSLSTLEKKQVNDAVAYIRGLAKLHQRNADWAEDAVRKASSLTATDALEANVIDLIAENVDDLLQKLDGRTLHVNEAEVTLLTQGLGKKYVYPDWRNKFLGVITNPNVAYILLLLGVYGLLFEFYNPGFGLPGIVGFMSLLLAGYALQMMPLSYAGAGLILLGIGLMMAEAFSPSFGIFGFGGVVSFVTGSIFLFDTDIEVFRVALPIIAALTIVSGLFLMLLLHMVIRSRKQEGVSGIGTFIGLQAVVIEGFDEEGMVKIEGELWNAVTKTPLCGGDTVKIHSISGLQLLVKPDYEE